MSKVVKQVDIGKYTLITLDTPIPNANFQKVVIENREYETEIAYDLKNSLGIIGKGNFENKEIQFI